MSLMTITAESLSRQLATEVPRIYVVIAKHRVMQMDDESIREVLNCTREEVEEVEATELYQTVRHLVGAAQAESRLQQATGWDFIEDSAIQGLAKRIPFEKDSEFLLRVAAVANKAQRRTQREQANVLDPAGQNGRTVVSLTRRLVEKLADGSQREMQQTLSIKNGGAIQPTFEDVDRLLGVSSTIESLPSSRFESDLLDIDELTRIASKGL